MMHIFSSARRLTEQMHQQSSNDQASALLEGFRQGETGQVSLTQVDAPLDSFPWPSCRIGQTL